MIDRTGQKKENVVRFSLKENNTLHKDPIRKTIIPRLVPIIVSIRRADGLQRRYTGRSAG